MSGPSKEVRKRYYQNNREKILAKEKARYLENPTKFLEYQKEYRKDNREWITEKNKAKRKEKQQILVELLGNCCSNCKNTFPLCVYDFHHVDPTTKLFTIGEHMGKALKTLKEEASKCILLCANCHRMIHDY